MPLDLGRPIYVVEHAIFSTDLDVAVSSNMGDLSNFLTVIRNRNARLASGLRSDKIIESFDTKGDKALALVCSH